MDAATLADASPTSPTSPTTPQIEMGMIPGMMSPASAQRAEREFKVLHPGRFRVIAASLEHSIPHLGCKAQAGGLGKVMNLVARHHPTDILMIHPKLQDVTYRRLSAS